MMLDASFKDFNFTIEYSSMQKFFDDVFEEAKLNKVDWPIF